MGSWEKPMAPGPCSSITRRQLPATGPAPQRSFNPPHTPCRQRGGTCGRLIHLLGLASVDGLNAAARPVVEGLLDGDGTGNAAHGEAGTKGAEPGQKAGQPRPHQHRLGRREGKAVGRENPTGDVPVGPAPPGCLLPQVRGPRPAALPGARAPPGGSEVIRPTPGDAEVLEVPVNCFKTGKERVDTYNRTAELRESKRPRTYISQPPTAEFLKSSSNSCGQGRDARLRCKVCKGQKEAQMNRSTAVRDDGWEQHVQGTSSNTRILPPPGSS